MTTTSRRPAALAAAVILCTAWTAPQALMERDVMKTIQLNWKRVVMVRATLDELNLIAAAMETLGGTSQDGHGTTAKSGPK